MTVEVKMPQLGESVFEGMVGKWLKQVGDHVEKYAPLLEVVTDKVDTEVTAADSGTLLEIRVAEGETVKVGTVLAVLGAAGEAAAAGRSTPATSNSATPPASTSAVSPDPSSGTAPTSGSANGAPPPSTNGAPARVSPVALRVAAEHGVDASQVPGTGRGGQVTREDVERYVAGRSPGPSEASAMSPAGGSSTGAPVGFISPRVARIAAEKAVNLAEVRGTGANGRVTSQDVERFVAQRATGQAAAVGAIATTGVATGAPSDGAAASSSTLLEEILELTPMRRAIADHMVRSKHTSPHVTTVHEVDMSQVVAAYEQLKRGYAERGVKLGYTSFFIHVLAQAIAKHPLVNSSWTDAGIQLHRDVNIGMAVAVAQGLIVPVIRHADEKSLIGLAREINDLAARARERKLVPDEVRGGTFTLTNYGTLGGLFGTPVINQPQAAILGVGAIKKRVVVVEGPGGDSIAIRPMMFLALTFDHRILDGGSADPFMQSVVQLLEHYEV